jgi:hypothetical protein
MRSSGATTAAGDHPVERHFNAAIRVILLFIGISALPGCFQHYFSSQTQTHVDGATIEKLKSADKYFILHGQHQITGLKNIAVSNDTLEANIVTLPPEHSKYTEVPEHGTKNVVRRKDEKNTLSEVHLYTSAKIDSAEKHISLPLSSVNQIDVYEFNSKATKANNALSWVGIVLGTAFAALIIAIIAGGGFPVE